MISYPVASSGQCIEIADEVLAHFERHRQTRFWHREAGGLLFAKLDLPKISVMEATGPRPTDRRSRYSYSPDVHAEQLEIQIRFKAGIDFVGCWHTHPEAKPTPSHIDVRNTSECVRRSRHALNGFLMIIVGQAEVGESLFVSVCDHNTFHQLRPGPKAGLGQSFKLSRPAAMRAISIGSSSDKPNC